MLKPAARGELNIHLDCRVATPHFPGIGRYVANLAAALPPLLGPGERLIALRNPGQPALASRVLDVAASPFSFSQQWQVPHSLAGAAGVYHSAYYVMPYRTPLPAILTVYDLIPLAGPRPPRILFAALLRLALASSRAVIAISEATRRELTARRRIAPGRVRVIPLAAGREFSPRPEPEFARVRARYGLPERYALYVGINKPHKNLPRLVEAWGKALPTAASRQANALVIAGPWDPRYPEAKRAASRLDLVETVRFLGHVQEGELPALYSGAAMVVCPSLAEGFGLPVLEAMSCGAPVACSDRASLPEVAGGAALLFDPLSTSAIAAAMSELLERPALAKDLAARGFERSRSFTWEKTAAATLEVYRSVAVS